jgi:hypothetical protein
VSNNESSFIDGKCERLLFSRKGGVDGVLIRIRRAGIVQVAMHAADGMFLARCTAPGKPIRLLAIPDHSAKAARSPHPVYIFCSYADPQGKAIESDELLPADIRMGGTVAALHFARHGQPNGVVLESGEFIHLRPRGMLKVAPVIGAVITAIGQLRITLLGTRMLEAHQINGESLR